MNVAVIPARGGSKRIPKKNIKPFCGKPIIAYSIEAAIASELFNEVIVSTDDKKISETAKEYGAKVPFKRPAELSNDDIGNTQVIAHSVNWMQQQGWKADTVCSIYATAPFIQLNDLRLGYNILQTNKWDFVFAATEYVYPIQRSFRLLNNDSVIMMSPENFPKRSQDLEVCYHDAGQFYWGKSEAWLEKRMIFSEISTVVNIPPYRAVDIDTQEDWKRAELLFEIIKAKNQI